jgi:hypothetical protein
MDLQLSPEAERSVLSYLSNNVGSDPKKTAALLAIVGGKLVGRLREAKTEDLVDSIVLAASHVLPGSKLGSAEGQTWLASVHKEILR